MGKGQRLSRHPTWRDVLLALRDVANDGLAALADIHLLHRDRLLAARPVALQCFHLRYKGSRKLVERTLRTVSMIKMVGLSEAA